MAEEKGKDETCAGASGYRLKMLPPVERLTGTRCEERQTGR